jgi:putative ABC transport system permease protein
MILHNLQIAFRNIFRNKTYSAINWIGLSLGMSCCFLIMLFVMHEMSYDNFHKKKDRIYRVNYTNTNDVMARCPTPVAKAMKNSLSGIEESARLYERNVSIIIKEEKSEILKFNEEKFFFADPEIFEILDFEFLRGNPAELGEPFTIGLNENQAKKFFGEKDPINRQILLDGVTPLTVKAVLKDFPSNSHIHFNFISNYETMFKIEGEKIRDNLENNWVASHSFTYLLLEEGTSPDEINTQIPKLLDDNVKHSFRNVIDFSLQPVTEIHMDSSVEINSEPTGNLTYIYILSAIAILIIMIACINFINLAIANSLKRMKEVGVRKVMGATKSQLIKRFMAESFIICIAAFLTSILLIEFGIPFLNAFTGRNLQFEEAFDFPFVLSIVIIFLLTATISGSYPAYVASNFEPANILKGDNNTGSPKTGLLSKGLIIFQFTASVLLISGSLIIYKQLKYLQDMNLGFDKELVISVPVYNENFNNAFRGITPETKERMYSFEKALLVNPKIKASTLSFEIPGRGAVTNIAIPEGFSVEDNLFTAFLSVDYDFIETYRLKIVEGRGFSKEAGTDHIDAMIINESAVKRFGWSNEEAIGKSFHLFKPCTIIGIVEDFHFSSLRDNIEPLGLAVIPSMFNFFSIKVENGQLKKTISFIKEKWEEFFPEKAFEYSFVDQQLESNYRSEQNLGKLINSFSLIAIFISCLGLFGLVAFTTASKAKEIGIRKVLGASTASISVMISGNFLKFILLSNIFALPLSYYLMDKWLEDFAVRISLIENAWVFIVAGILTLVIALFTINTKAISAASTNPVKVLNKE